MPDEGEFSNIVDIIKQRLGINKQQFEKEERDRLDLDRKSRTTWEKRARQFVQEITELERKEELERKAEEAARQNETNELNKKLTAEQRKQLTRVGLTNIKTARKYRVPKGSDIVLPPSQLGDGDRISPSDCILLISSKTVAYDPIDVCLDPTTGKCTIDFLKGSMYIVDGGYYGFHVPTNDKNITFILVPLKCVEIEWIEDRSVDRQKFIDAVHKMKNDSIL